jgi:hypothetical protein
MEMTAPISPADDLTVVTRNGGALAIMVERFHYRMRWRVVAIDEHGAKYLVAALGPGEDKLAADTIASDYAVERQLWELGGRTEPLPDLQQLPGVAAPHARPKPVQLRLLAPERHSARRRTPPAAAPARRAA